MDKSLVRSFVEKGWPIICATCTHLPEGLDKGLNGCAKSLSRECSGPKGGSTFPEYSGPIPRPMFPFMCLICGHSQIKLQVVVAGKPEFALCDQHVKSLDGLSQQPKQGEIAKPSGDPLIIEV